MNEFAAVYRQNQLRDAREDIVRKAAAHSLARHGLVKAEALDLCRLLFQEGVKETASTFLRPLQQLQEERFLDLKKRWLLLALVLPCSAVDLVCGLFLKAEEFQFGTAVEFSRSEMVLYKAVLAELADETAGVVVDLITPDDDTTALFRGDFSLASLSNEILTSGYVSQAIETASQTFAKRSLRTLRADSHFQATVEFLKSLESFLSKTAEGSGSTTPPKGHIDLDGFTITSSAPGTVPERPQM